jgi:hypothetical protein
MARKNKFRADKIIEELPMEEHQINETPKEEIPTTEKVSTNSGEFGQKEADELAASYLPEGDVPKSHKTMWVTSDKNVFLVHNEGTAKTHARNQKLKVFKVEN